MAYQSKHTGADIDAGIDAANAALPKNGGTMTGALLLARTPESDKEAATKDYVDAAIQEIELTPGASAYEVAVENGYEGTETEWLASLKGDAGADGAPGANGADGEDGADGVGIVSIAKTATAGLVDTYTITLSDNSTYTFTVTNGVNGSGGEGGGTVYMQVSDGYIQYSNDGATWANVIAVSELKGADGTDGVSCTHSWDGTTLTITSASGTSSADLKGEKGDKGDPGESAAGVDYSTSEVALGINWIDGKPIYRRVVSFLACQANDTATTSEAISDFDTIISFNGALHRTSDGEVFPLNYYKNTAAWIFTQVDAYGRLEVTGKVSLAGTVVAWLDYTKTTD